MKVEVVAVAPVVVDDEDPLGAGDEGKASAVSRPGRAVRRCRAGWAEDALFCRPVSRLMT